LARTTWIAVLVGVAVIALLVANFVVWPAIKRSNDVNDIVVAAKLNGIELKPQQAELWFDALGKCSSEEDAKQMIAGYLNMNNASLQLANALILAACPYARYEHLKHGDE
jgi:hypothetical protein